MEFTNEELVTLSNFLNGSDELPVAVSEINDRIRAVVSPVAPQPEAAVEEEVAAPAPEEAAADTTETPADTESVA